MSSSCCTSAGEWLGALGVGGVEWDDYNRKEGGVQLSEAIVCIHLPPLLPSWHLVFTFFSLFYICHIFLLSLSFLSFIFSFFLSLFYFLSFCIFLSFFLVFMFCFSLVLFLFCSFVALFILIIFLSFHSFSFLYPFLSVSVFFLSSFFSNFIFFIFLFTS